MSSTPHIIYTFSRAIDKSRVRVESIGLPLAENHSVAPICYR